MEAFAAGKVDAVMMTMGDALVTGAPGARSVAILVTDYSNGNDMIVAKPGIDSLKELKGKKVGLEIGLVEHLMLPKALEKTGLKESATSSWSNVPTHQTAQALASGNVDAIGAWQPNAGQALKAVAGSKAIFTSADVPGLIYDLVCVNPQSLAAAPRRLGEGRQGLEPHRRRSCSDPANKDEAVKIMAGARRRAARGVRDVHARHALPDARGGAQALRAEGRRSTSLYGSGKVADEFNVANKVYAEPQPVDDVHRRLAVEGGARQVRRVGASSVRTASTEAPTMRGAWSRPLAGLSPARQRAGCGRLSFVVPLAALVRGQLRAVHLAPDGAGRRSGRRPPGSRRDLLVERAAFAARERRAGGADGRPAVGERANPVFLPAPHEVVRALVTGFTTPPARPDEPWLHQSLWHSIQVIFWGFLVSSLIGVPLGILCGALPALGALDRAVHRVLPLPAGAGVRRAGASRCWASTTRPRSRSSSSARSSSRCWSSPTPRAGSIRRCSRRRRRWARRARTLLTRVVVPGVITDIYTDMRVLLGWAWTYLIVAELIGVSSRHHATSSTSRPSTGTTIACSRRSS